MRKLYSIIFLAIIMFIPQAVMAEGVVPAASAITSNNTGLDFSKSYNTNSENLLYLLLAAINEHNYAIEEIQFKTGSVLFKAYQKEFIASIAAKDGYNAFIKIIPADNNYNFSPLLLQRLHSYIESNNGISFKKIL